MRKVLIYNKDFGRWSVLVPKRGEVIRDIDICGGELVLIIQNRLCRELALADSVARRVELGDGRCRIEMDWFNLRDLQGYVRLRTINVLHKFYVPNTTINCYLFYDYDSNLVEKVKRGDTTSDEEQRKYQRFEIKTPSVIKARDAERVFRIKPRRQKCSSFLLVFEVPSTNKPFTISGLTLKYAAEAEGMRPALAGASTGGSQ